MTQTCHLDDHREGGGQWTPTLKLVMTESYPRQRILPYVLAGVVLFCFVLTPRDWWQRVVSDVTAATRPSTTASSRPPLVVVERGNQVRASVTAAMLRPTETPPTRDVDVRDGDRYVWQPPEGWVPGLIEPLRVEPQPPVANRVDGSKFLPARDREVEPPREAEAAPSLSLSASSDGEPQQDEPNAPPRVVPEQQTQQPATTPGDAGSTNVALTHSPAAVWPTSDKIHELLAEGAGDRVLGAWSAEIRAVLATLEGSELTDGRTQRQPIQQLRQLSVVQVSQRGWTPEQIQLFRRICFALKRRIDVWEPLVQLASGSSRVTWPMETARLAETTDRLWRSLSMSDQRAVSDALQLGDVVRALPQLDPRGQRELAESTLAKLLAVQSEAAATGMSSAPLVEDYAEGLRHYIGVSIPLPNLLQAMEAYETSSTQANAENVIAHLQRMALRDDTAPLIEAIQLHYRNANVRVSVSEDLINRVFPAIHQYAEQVNDTILGAAVRGHNSTLTNLSVQLIPDKECVRCQLLAQGRVQSNTMSRKGPVTMFNRGRSTFLAGKEVVLQPHGIYVSPTQAQADTGNRLVKLQTELDQIPLIGWMLRSVAERQQMEQRPFLRAEILRRVRQSTVQRMDREVEQRLAKVEANFATRMKPLYQLQLEPRAMEMQTTNDRVIMRSRLASPLQLAAHTPRPQALANSKLSVQLHQSAVNNLIERLELHGRRLTVGELFEELSHKLDIDLQVPHEQHADAVIEFAETHPFEVEFEHDAVSLTVRVAELEHGGRTWNDFGARATYRATARKLDVELIRDEGIELISDRLRLGDQVALRGIFTRVFSKNSRLAILRKAIQDQERLQQLCVTQLTVRDGWIGIALGDSPTEVQTARAHRSVR